MINLPFASLAPWMQTLSSNPSLFFLQLTMVVGAALLVFLVLFTTRDILLRSRSFVIQFLCILLVALVPGIGFLLYLLVRPARTNRERMLEELVMDLSDEVRELSDQVTQRKPMPAKHMPPVFKMHPKKGQGHGKDSE